MGSSKESAYRKAYEKAKSQEDLFNIPETPMFQEKSVENKPKIDRPPLTRYNAFRPNIMRF